MKDKELFLDINRVPKHNLKEYMELQKEVEELAKQFKLTGSLYVISDLKDLHWKMKELENE